MKVSPTCVGMNRRHRRLHPCVCRKPHVRGDEPHQQELQNIRAMETPQVWGYMQRR